MTYVKQMALVQVTLPDGRKINRSDLPERDIKRWTARHKRVLVEAVAYGLLGRQEVEETYAISPSEFDSWVELITTHGPEALKATRLGKYRSYIQK